MTHTARCSCGQLALSFDGERPPASMCHCFACQRRTGSAYGLQVLLDKDRVHIRGEATTWQRTGDEGAIVTSSFCATCATTLYWELDVMPGKIIVAVGAFNDPTWPAPTFSVYEERAHRWWVRPESVTTSMD